MNLTSLIYDFLALAIICIAVKKGAKEGFAKTAIQTVGTVASAVCALVISRICASLIYSVAVAPAVTQKLEEAMSGAADAESIIEGLVSAIEGLPAVSSLFFNFEDAARSLIDSVGFDYHAIAVGIEEKVISPMLEPLLETVFFFIALIILLIAVSLAANGSKLLNAVPIISGVNSFFGGIFGILNGAIQLFIGAVIIEAVISAGVFPEFFSEEIISETLLFRWIYFFSPGDNLIV